MKIPEIEKQHVHEVYDIISKHWSETRYKPWPKVVEFIKQYNNSTFIGDIGCGNGKYLPCFLGNVFGVDFSIPMMETINSNNNLNFKKANHDLCSADITNLQIKDNIFDAAICIAVLHHISTVERRIHALSELHRILVIGGRVLIYAWAEKQEIDSRHQFSEQDNLVPWTLKRKGHTDKVYQRYCHTFREGEMPYLISKIKGLKLISEYYDSGNWCAVAEKILII
jgi:ubiquinone/menaquinone biosynthesis C-methylase UbiE